MNFRGCIDNYRLIENYLTISGWIKLGDNEKDIPLDVNNFYLAYKNKVQKINEVAIITRPDISKDQNFGFTLKIHNHSINNLANKLSVVRYCHDEWEFEIPFWDKLREQILSSPTLKNLEIPYTKIYANIGCVSLDGNSILGKNGEIYLIKGSNNILDQYSNKYESRGDKWISLIEKRKETIENLGCKYLQFIIPDKISIERNNFPFILDNEMTLNLKVVNNYYSINKSDHYLDIYNTLKDKNIEYPVFHKTDVHMSFVGTKITFDKVLERIGEKEIIEVPDLELKIIEGTFSNEFFCGILYEEIYLPSNNNWNFSSKDVKLIEQANPSNLNAHIGIKRVWKCVEPISKKRIIIFGSSSCERGGTPIRLSWWFMRYFAEVHFLWQPEIDIEYIKEVNPDFVICQGTERFMEKVPRN